MTEREKQIFRLSRANDAGLWRSGMNAFRAGALLCCIAMTNRVGALILMLAYFLRDRGAFAIGCGLHGLAERLCRLSAFLRGVPLFKDQVGQAP